MAKSSVSKVTESSAAKSKAVKNGSAVEAASYTTTVEATSSKTPAVAASKPAAMPASTPATTGHCFVAWKYQCARQYCRGGNCQFFLHDLLSWCVAESVINPDPMHIRLSKMRIYFPAARTRL
jgi:hypothetical protein